MSYKVTLTIGGQDFVYPSGPAHEYYFVTPFKDGSISFHFGVLGNLPQDQDPHQPYDLDAYVAKIEIDGALVATVNVPAHWWNARWTYYPNPIQTVKSPAQLVAARRMFPFGNTGSSPPPPPNTPACTLMGSSSVTIYMPTTGERPDIGNSTDNSGYYMLGFSGNGMVQWALAGTTCPMHFRDQNTGRPVDLLKYPGANSYDQPQKQGAPWFAKGKLQPNGYTEFGGGWTPQQAHYCEMSYAAYQATRNPAFLEDLQYSANFTILCDASRSGQTGKPTVSGELRGIAWAFRNLFMAHAATLDAEAAGELPDSCHTSSYWKQLLDIQLAYYSQYMADPANQYYRLVPGPWTTFGPWQVDYMLTALAFGVLTGHADWAPFYVWALKNVIDRTNNTPWQSGGFPPGWGTPYYVDAKPTWYDAFVTGNIDVHPSQAQIDALKLDPLNGGKAMQGQEYLMTTRAALVMADYLDKNGLANVRAAYPLDTCLQICTTMNKNYGAMNPRVAVISTGGIIMPSSVSIVMGQKVHLDVTFVGPNPPAAPSYTQTDATVGGLSNGDMSGVLFTSTKVGTSTVTASAVGASGPISSACVVTVNPPLPTGITLSPGQIS